MKTMKVTTLSPDNDLREFVYQCESGDTALAIVSGTLKACQSTGWILVNFETV